LRLLNQEINAEMGCLRRRSRWEVQNVFRRAEHWAYEWRRSASQRIDMGKTKRDIQTLRTSEEERPQMVNSVARAFSILRCFEQGEQFLGNRDLVRQTRLAKATVSRLTYTLARLGYLEYSPSLEKYSLGGAVLALSHAYLKNNDLVAVARPLMQKLADETQAAVLLGAADGPRMLVLEVCQGDSTFQLKIAAGARVPRALTALGRADLAVRPLAEFEQALHELEKECEPELWRKTRDGIVRARREYEDYGFCSSLGSWKPDVLAVGTPMVSADRSRVVAFSCSGRESVVTREQLNRDFGPKVVALRNSVLERTEGRF
jgi:DNA-binding IclR family transcriptional regulator